MNSVYLRTHIIDMEEKFENTKEVIRIHIWKKNRQKKKEEKDKQRSTKHTHKTKDRVTRTPLRTEAEQKGK